MKSAYLHQPLSKFLPCVLLVYSRKHQFLPIIAFVSFESSTFILNVLLEYTSVVITRKSACSLICDVEHRSCEVLPQEIRSSSCPILKTTTIRVFIANSSLDSPFREQFVVSLPEMCAWLGGFNYPRLKMKLKLDTFRVIQNR